MKKAVIIYGPPGSGKGTQANLLAGKIGLVHFDTGKYIEQLIHDPANRKNKEIQEQLKIFDSGALCTPSWVLKIISKKTTDFSKAGLGMAFSGSPRTMFEAFGDKTRKGLIAILEKEFGKNNIILVLLKINPRVSILRNSHRLVCSVCGAAILYNDAAHKHTTCPTCGGKLKKRTVDNPKVFSTRIKEYEKRTKPILAALKKQGYKILEINARPLPYLVFNNILKKLQKRFGN